MSLVQYDLFGECRDKVKRSIEIVRRFEPSEGYYLADSGGKDSAAAKAISVTWAMCGMVQVGRTLSADELDTLEDSIASYAEAYEDYCIEELIHDVLEAAGVEHWIISPMRTYRI